MVRTRLFFGFVPFVVIKGDDLDELIAVANRLARTQASIDDERFPCHRNVLVTIGRLVGHSRQVSADSSGRLALETRLVSQAPSRFWSSTSSRCVRVSVERRLTWRAVVATLRSARLRSRRREGCQCPDRGCRRSPHLVARTMRRLRRPLAWPSDSWSLVTLTME